MKILLIDAGDNFLDFALRCLAAGHQVKWFQREYDGKRDCVGKGLVDVIPKGDGWKNFMRWADLIVLADNSKYLQQLDTYRAQGYPIFGPTWESSQLELDRMYGQDVLKSCGVEVTEGEQFTDYGKAEKYIIKMQNRFVSKPCGDADRSLSYVAKDEYSKDLIYMLRKWQNLGKITAPFIVQEFIKGMEVAIGGWFGPNGFSKWFLENWEFKKLMAGSLGQNTGEVGTTMRYTKKSKLADMLLKPCAEILHGLNYTGYIDVAALIAEDGTPYPLEFTARPGWPGFQILQSLHMGDPAIWMKDLLEGYDTLQVDQGICTGHVMFLPPFPYSKGVLEEHVGVPIYAEIENPNIHWCGVKLGSAPDSTGKDQPCMVSASNYLLVSTGVADTVSDSMKKSRNVLERIIVPGDPGWRIDVGERLQKELPRLQKMGYCLGVKYG